MSKSYFILVWLLVKVTLTIFTCFVGTLVALMLSKEQYEIGAVFTALWFLAISLVSIKEEKELYSKDDNT
ncbi:hypothetical protein ACNRWW_14155 [Metabacillus sp. HB246100]